MVSGLVGVMLTVAPLARAQGVSFGVAGGINLAEIDSEL